MVGNRPLATVEIWRIDQLRRIGCQFSEVKLIEELNLDWHDVAKLVENGCPVNLAIEILR